jgi:hypothetical protein
MLEGPTLRKAVIFDSDCFLPNRSALSIDQASRANGQGAQDFERIKAERSPAAVASVVYVNSKLQICPMHSDGGRHD